MLVGAPNEGFWWAPPPRPPCFSMFSIASCASTSISRRYTLSGQSPSLTLCSLRSVMLCLRSSAMNTALMTCSHSRVTSGARRKCWTLIWASAVVSETERSVTLDCRLSPSARAPSTSMRLPCRRRSWRQPDALTASPSAVAPMSEIMFSDRSSTKTEHASSWRIVESTAAPSSATSLRLRSRVCSRQREVKRQHASTSKP
mmetsp:Transcript_10383/g.24435  ORF Transcript_10383/g.24435 Transcript_10383/m.24435 type:complete len:201 (-) Transcript_10383:758-1360(-)